MDRRDDRIEALLDGAAGGRVLAALLVLAGLMSALAAAASLGPPAAIAAVASLGATAGLLRPMLPRLSARNWLWSLAGGALAASAATFAFAGRMGAALAFGVLAVLAALLAQESCRT